MSVLDQLAALLVAHAPGRRYRVAVDGVDGSGKTTLADRLAEAVAPQRPVVRASVDSFHRPQAERYRRGRASPQGCYLDTFDLDALRGRLLEPFAADGSYVCAVFDHVLDRPVDAPVRQAAGDAVLIVDGVFLQRPELTGCFELVVHLRIDDDEVLRRVVRRDAGEPEQIRERYLTRYLPAQRLYEEQCSPAEQADVLLDSTDLCSPRVLRGPATARGVPLLDA